MEILTRGPVHEAFAEPVAIDPNEQAVTVPEQPPEPVDEIPPDARPEDASAVWIPGYWQWDDVENRFLWISGTWRIPPSGQRWVPGYWTEGEGGYQYVNGFWSPVTEQQVQYLPEPPETLEVGPNTAAPSDDHFWIPGCWIYSNNDYRWRPGYWHPISQNWLWIPDRYVWTPRGYVFCNGYWDFADWTRRGLLFAPVHFHRPLYRTAGFYFTPRVFLNVGFLTNHFFHRPGHRHYYFGDYYGGPYARLGFHHWFSWNRRGRGWDPYFNHFRWKHAKHNPRWHDHWRDRYEHFTRHDRDRPPHTWKKARDWERRDGNRREWDRDRFVGTTIDDAVRRRDGRSSHRFAKLDDAQRSRYREHARKLRDVARQRGDIEGRDRRGGRVADRTGNRDFNRGSFRLPDVDRLRPDIERRTAGRERDARGDRFQPRTDSGELPGLGRRADRQPGRGARDRIQPRTDSGDIPGLANRTGERSRTRQREDVPRQFDSRRFENLPRADRNRERSVLGRRSVARVPLETPEARRTPRQLEGRRQIGLPQREFDRRRQLDRSRGRSELENGRRTVPQSRELRRSEGAAGPGFRFDSRSRGEIRPRGEIRRSPSFERRSFSPPSRGPSRQQFSRPQSPRRIEAAPRGEMRFDSRSRGNSGGRSIRSSGRGGGERSFRSGGSSSRGRSSGFSGRSNRGKSSGGGKGKRGKG